MDRKRFLKVNAGMSKVMMLGVEEGLECEVCVSGMRLEYVLEFKYLGYVLDESGTDDAECHKKVVSRRRVAGSIRSLVNATGLQLESARVLHETFLMPILMYCSEIIIWKKKEVYIIVISCRMEVVPYVVQTFVFHNDTLP